ncbi:tetratricopeptide repeat protein, partial [Enterococcus faecalis]|uniref:tetratricopeptide repeat protein n=1 Tax=Enterococcus faecalis TaxID=1351 RepID=UPI00403F1549
EAEPILRRALVGREKVLGPDHPEVADTLVTLIYLLRSQGRFAEAAALAERPLAIYRKALGPSHPLVVWGLRTLAIVQQDRAEFA